MHVNLLAFTRPEGDPDVVAVIRMVDGKIQIEGTLHARTVNTIEGEYLLMQTDPRFEGKRSDEDFLRRLPFVFSGTYTRAEFVP